MRVAFHTNQLCLRGTNVAEFDYAKHNQTLLGNESLILYDVNNSRNVPLAVQHFKKHFHVRGYERFSEVDSILKEEKVEFCYMLKAGYMDGKLPKSCRVGVHVVFQYHYPHGDVYAFTAEWLTNKMTGGKYPFVPLGMFDMPIQKSRDLRNELGIPRHAIVFGRHGGETEFNLPFVHRAIKDVARRYPKDIYFLFMNTNRFCPNLPNIIYLSPTPDLQEKTNFILACDAMIHARTREEAVRIFERLGAEGGLSEGRMLWSVREFKKASPMFFSETAETGF